MKGNQFLLAGYAEILPITPAFVMPMFLKGGVWYRQLTGDAKARGFERVRPENVAEISRADFEKDIFIGPGDGTVYGFGVSDRQVYFGFRQNLSRALMQLSPDLIARRHLYAKVYDFVFDEPGPPERGLSRKSWSSTLICRDRLEQTSILEALPPGELIHVNPFHYARTADFFNGMRQHGEPPCIVAGGIEGEALLEGLSQFVIGIEKKRCFFESESKGKASKNKFSNLLKLARNKFKRAEIFVCLPDSHYSAPRFHQDSNIFQQAARRLSPGFMDWQAEKGMLANPLTPRGHYTATSMDDLMHSSTKNKGSLH